MPRAEVTLRDTLPGAFLAGLLWEVAKYIFAWSLQLFSLRSDLWLGRRGGCGADVELRFEFDNALRRSTTAVFHYEHPSVTVNSDAHLRV